jgi:preprotein translocase subunit SecE
MSKPTPMMPSFASSPTKFLKEVKAELKKVVWPSRKEVVKLTIIVVIVSIIIGAYIGVLDFIFTGLMNLLVKR